ncbi:hypothetical protein D0T49_09220 [Paludibacter sp. 221]|uniref:hypothetical protein n=1 Tax=Paludibacter sp. 221 TaxID=2302939 RepID=UPI0013CF77C9|nr:hypothetical protein [Paludibacter sp. 221]NDV47223.1 hypothetical protein [Paludibacter sp. 221]
MEKQTLSSKWTNTLLILMTVLWVVLPLCCILFLLITGSLGRIHPGMVIGGILLLLMIGATVFLLSTLAKVTVTDDKIIFKKAIGRAKSYTFDKITYPNEFRFHKLLFTSINMKNGYEEDFYLILSNRRAWVLKDQIDVKQSLLTLKYSVKNEQTKN